MTLKQAKQATAPVVPAVLAPAPVAVRRIYMDITGHVDAALEAAAKAKGQTKKAFVESLILASVGPRDVVMKGRK